MTASVAAARAASGTRHSSTNGAATAAHISLTGATQLARQQLPATLDGGHTAAEALHRLGELDAEEA
jgi:hypothetical protein